MVMTVVEARIPAGREAELTEAYERGTQDGLPPSMVETFLLHDGEAGLWRIATVWRSWEALEEYRASVETPGAIVMFRAVGAEPSVGVFDVVRRVS